MFCLGVCIGCTEVAQESARTDPGQQATDSSDVDQSDESESSEPGDDTETSVEASDDEPADSSSVDDPEEPEEEVPLDGFGEISGSCGILDLMTRQQEEPFLIQNAIDFSDDPYDESDLSELTDGGREIISDGNAGGQLTFV